jgi:hypothetical protein
MVRAERPQDQPIVDRWLTPNEGPEPPPEPKDPWERGKRAIAKHDRQSKRAK